MIVREGNSPPGRDLGQRRGKAMLATVTTSDRKNRAVARCALRVPPPPPPSDCWRIFFSAVAGLFPQTYTSNDVLEHQSQDPG